MVVKTGLEDRDFLLIAHRRKVQRSRFSIRLVTTHNSFMVSAQPNSTIFVSYLSRDFIMFFAVILHIRMLSKIKIDNPSSSSSDP